MATCPKCNAEIADEISFCDKCGEQLVEGAQRNTHALGGHRQRLADSQHEKHIKKARRALMIVAILTIIASAALYFFVQNAKASLEDQIRRIKNSEYMTLDQKKIDEARTGISHAYIMVTISFVIGFVYIGLFLWAKSNPFTACLIGLVIFVSTMAIGLSMAPDLDPIAWAIRVLIILALTSGVRSGLAYNKLKANTIQSL